MVAHEVLHFDVINLWSTDRCRSVVQLRVGFKFSDAVWI